MQVLVYRPLWRSLVILGSLIWPTAALAHDTGTPHVEFDSFTTGFTTLLVGGLISLLVGLGLYYRLKKRALMRDPSGKKDSRLY